LVEPIQPAKEDEVFLGGTVSALSVFQQVSAYFASTAGTPEIALLDGESLCGITEEHLGMRCGKTAQKKADEKTSNGTGKYR
jgi:hypothetical protein